MSENEDARLETQPLPDDVVAEADFQHALRRSDGEPSDRLSLLWILKVAPTDRAFVVIGLNPSGAASDVADRTLNRCWSFARREGFGRLLMLNLFSARATVPEDLLKYPGRPGAHRWANVLARRALEVPGSVVVAAWGAPPTSPRALRDLVNQRRLDMQALLVGAPLHALGVTQDGHPRHPLYMRADSPLVPWSPPT
jgi:hypothetical protein